jgi:hypothetical protein
MNLGSVLGLIGFGMSNILFLRWLAIAGSICGIIYNLTRNPVQINASMWAAVFIALNLVMIWNLFKEDVIDMEPIEENIYMKFFRTFGVSPGIFQKLVDAGNTSTTKDGARIPVKGQFLDKVFFVFSGNEVSVYGGSAIKHPEIAKSPYPTDISIPPHATMLACPQQNLKTLMESDQKLAAAIYHILYVDSRRKKLALKKKLETSA